MIAGLNLILSELRDFEPKQRKKVHRRVAGTENPLIFAPPSSKEGGNEQQQRCETVG